MNKIQITRCLALLGIVCVLAACGGDEKQLPEKKAVVKIDTVRQVSANDELQFPGRIVAASETNVSFKVPGTLRKVYVKKGDPVKKGQLIAELDDSDYRVQLSATEAEYSQIKAEAERVMGLYEDGGTTASNYDKARYGLQQIEAKLTNHRNQVTYTRLYAPVSGAVQTSYFNGGETIGAGMPVLSILTDGDLEVEVNLDPKSYMLREQFSTFTCICDVLPNDPLQLQMINVLPRANSNQLYTMRLKLDAEGRNFAAGMTAWVKIGTTAQNDQHFVVPTTSVLKQGDKTYIYTYDANAQTVHQLPVDVLELHTDGTAVVHGDMKAGDLVVSSGVHHVSDGLKVQPMEKTSPTNVGGML